MDRKKNGIESKVENLTHVGLFIPRLRTLKRVKITIFGLTLSSSWGNGHATPYRALIRALGRLGHRVHFFEKDVPYYRSRRDFDSCGYCDLTLYPDWASIRDQALSAAADSDVVITASFLPEGRRINDEMLDLARPLRVFYDLDTPVTLANLRQGEVEYLDARPASRIRPGALVYRRKSAGGTGKPLSRADGKDTLRLR